MPVPDLQAVPVLVTGGAGFIGSHLVDALVEGGADVRVLDNLATGTLTNLEGRLDAIECVEGDIRDPETCRVACAGRAVVFHQAALGSVPRSIEDPLTSLEVNVRGTANVFEGCRLAGVGRIVYASSSSVYGDSARLPKVEGEEGAPLSPYATSKAMTETLAAGYRAAYGLTLVGLRYFNIYGPRQDPDGPYAAVVPRFFQAILSGTSPTVYGDGAQSRDFTYVADAVQANLLAAGIPDGPQAAVVNIAGGGRTSIGDLAGAIAKVVGSDVQPVYEPPRAGDVRHSQADLGEAGRLLGFRPETSLEAGLEESLAHYRSRSTA